MKTEYTLTPAMCAQFFNDLHNDLHKEQSNSPIYLYLTLDETEEIFTLSNAPSFLHDVEALRRQQYTVPSVN